MRAQEGHSKGLRVGHCALDFFGYTKWTHGVRFAKGVYKAGVEEVKEMGTSEEGMKEVSRSGGDGRKGKGTQEKRMHKPE